MSYDLQEVLIYSDQALSFIAGHEQSGCPESKSDPGKLQKESYIDCSNSKGIKNFGRHGDRIAQAVKNQLNRQVLKQREFINPLQGMLSCLLTMISPGNLSCALITTSGSEAVQYALQLAGIQTGKQILLSASGWNYGDRLLSLNINGRGDFLKQPFKAEPQLEAVPFNDIDTLHSAVVKAASSKNPIGAVILEPIQVEGGVIVPSEEYFNQVRHLCDEFGILLIIDETRIGVGCSGSLFAIYAKENYGANPDLICLGSSLAGGIIPVGALLAEDKVKETIAANFSLIQGLDGDNTLACAAAIAAIQVILSEGLIEQAAEKGSYILPKLERIARNYSFTKEARGRGLLLGLEFVNEETCRNITRELFEKGILVSITLNNPAAISIEPALTVEIETLDLLLESLEQALQKRV